MLCSNMTKTLNELWIDDNDFEGDLSPLAPTRLVWASVSDIESMCACVCV